MVTKRKRAEIPCILCKNPIELPEYVGRDYNGDLLCGKCGALLHIKLDKWDVKQVKVLRNRVKDWKGSGQLEYLQEKLAKARSIGETRKE